MAEISDPNLLQGFLNSRHWSRRELGQMLLQAARGSHTESFQLLLDNKASLTVRDPGDRNVFHLLLRYGMGNINILRPALNTLKKNQINSYLNCKDRKGYTPLYYAAERGYNECIRELLKVGVNLDQTSSYDRDTALMIAASKGLLDTVRLFLEAGANVHKKNFFWYTALILAAQRGQSACVKALIAAGANIHTVDYSGHNSLTKAAENGYVDTVKVLIEHGASVNGVDSTNRSAIFLAASYQHHAVIDYLLSVGADVNLASGIGFSPFLMAIKRDDLSLIEKLIKHGCNVMQVYMNEGNAVHMACLSNSYNCLKYLLESDFAPDFIATLDKTDEKGKTPLTLSCERVCVENVVTLLSHGANPDLLDKHGRSPLTCAIRGFNIFPLYVTKTIKALLRYGCDVNLPARLESAVICRHDGHRYRPADLQLPFEVAIRLGQVAIARMLWVAGCRPGQVLTWSEGTLPWYNSFNFPVNVGEREREETLGFLKEITASPPCLAHHCRTVIRAQLGHNIENRVQHLCLPETLKEFLSVPELDTIEEDFAALNQPEGDNSESEEEILSDSDLTETTEEDSDVPGFPSEESGEDDDDDDDD